MGESQASLSFSNGFKNCWTPNIGPGVYAIRVRQFYQNGSSSTFWQKIVVTP
jgi:hypothetical protein